MMQAYRNLGLVLLASFRTLVLSSNATDMQCQPNSLKISAEVNHRSHFLVIAHRGASFHLPEHTLAGYRLALELGADFIEPDLVATKDGKLIAMHTLDLNVTTNVVEVYGHDREPWFSPIANRSGYWTFNFTGEEISKLSVKQRIPEARTERYDNLWSVPALEDILQEINRWNSVDLPQLLSNVTEKVSGRPSVLELSQAGVYAELKASAWLKEEAGIDLVDLLYQHFEDFRDDWSELRHCYQEIPYGQYKAPGLVLQSFDAETLRAFHNRWEQDDGYNNVYAEPPYILLVDQSHCFEDDFWFNVGEDYRDFVNGVGPDKLCLLDAERGAAFAKKAKEYEMVLHPWTERPESNFLDDEFTSVYDETLYLFCQRGADGVFSESVSTAVMAANTGCDTGKGDATDGSTAGTPNGAGSDTNITNNSPVQGGWVWEEGVHPADVYLGLASFAIGAFVAVVTILCVSRRKRQFCVRQRHVAPSQDEFTLVLWQHCQLSKKRSE